MKIGIFDPYLDTVGGGEKYMLTIAQCLSKTHDVSIFWDLDNENIKKLVLKRFALDLSSIQFRKNIFSSHVPLAERVSIARKYDTIIYLSDGSLPLIGKKNLIVHFQFPVEWVNGHSVVTKLKLLQVKKIICNSQFTKTYIDKKFNVSSTILYPPVDILSSDTKKKEQIILHVGRFGIDREGANYKKQDVMINVFKTMVKNGLVGWRFFLIISVQENDKEKLQNLKEMTKGFPIEIVENPNNTVLHAFYKKAKIYWHASGFGEDLSKYPEKAEHFGIATVEAMGAGVVPVAINAGGQKEIVQDGENGFLWNTIDELIEKTSLIIKNTILLEKLSLQACKDAKQFNVDRFCEEINKIVYE